MKVVFGLLLLILHLVNGALICDGNNLILQATSKNFQIKFDISQLSVEGSYIKPTSDQESGFFVKIKLFNLVEFNSLGQSVSFDLTKVTLIPTCNQIVLNETIPNVNGTANETITTVLAEQIIFDTTLPNNATLTLTTTLTFAAKVITDFAGAGQNLAVQKDSFDVDLIVKNWTAAATVPGASLLNFQGQITTSLSALSLSVNYYGDGAIQSIEGPVANDLFVAHLSNQALISNEFSNATSWTPVFMQTSVVSVSPPVVNQNWLFGTPNATQDSFFHISAIELLPPKKLSGENIAVIIVGSVAGALLIGAVTGILVYMYRQNKKNKNKTKSSPISKVTDLPE